MTPSKYQIAIFDAVQNTQDNLLIDAVAGSGKTTTIVEALKIIEGQVLFVAFNKHIAEELKKRVPANTQVATLNSFGWRVCLSNVMGVKLDAEKTFNIFQSLHDMNDRQQKKDFWSGVGAVKSLVSLLKANLIFEPDKTIIENLAAKYSIDYNETDSFYQKFFETWKISINEKYYMDFDDQIFMPIYYNWQIPKFKTVMVDEAQDLSPFNQELVIRAGGRVIAVGDTRQAIYGFRGADPESMGNLQKRLSARVLPLSICYRCAKSVVKLAQTIVPHIEFKDDAPDGKVENVKTDAFRKNAKSEDYVLCRVTAPLVSECLKMIREGRKATVKGRDIGKSLITLIEKIYEGNDIEIFSLKLQEYEATQISRLSRMNKEAEIIALTDRTDTLKVFIESCDTVLEIRERIDRIFTDKVSGVVFCTVHKSKGLEAERIYILEPKLMPHPLAKQDWQKLQEQNLKYVAITRAMTELFWVN